MIENLKRLSKDSIIYGIGNAIEFAAGLILLPILTKIFTPEDYGVIDTVVTIISFLSLIIFLGLNSATQRFYFKETDSKKNSNTISTAFWFLVFFSITTVGILSFFSEQISALLFETTRYTNLIIVALLSIPFLLLTTFFKDVLRLKFKPLRFGFISITQLVVRVVFVLIFVTLFKMGLAGNFLGILVGALFTSAIALFFIRKEIVFAFSLGKIKKLLAFGVPLAFAGIAYWVISLSDRFLILKMLNLGDLGIYAVGNKIASVLLLFVTAVHLAWSPFIYETNEKQDIKPIITKTITYSLLFFLFIGVGITVFSNEAIKLLTTDEYLSAIYVIPTLVFGVVLLGVSGIISTGLSIVQKTSAITKAAIIAAGIKILLTMILIPHYGILGAAIATFLSYLALSLLYFYFGNKYFKIQLEYKRIILLLIIGAVFLYSSQFIKIDNNFAITIVMKLIYLCLFPALLFVTNFLSRQEKNFTIKTLFKR